MKEGTQMKADVVKLSNQRLDNNPIQIQSSLLRESKRFNEKGVMISPSTTELSNVPTAHAIQKTKSRSTNGIGTNANKLADLVESSGASIPYLNVGDKAGAVIATKTCVDTYGRSIRDGNKRMYIDFTQSKRLKLNDDSPSFSDSLLTESDYLKRLKRENQIFKQRTNTKGNFAIEVEERNSTTIT